jgi:hypothetical protein
VESAKYEGMTKEQCPLAKWVRKRSPENQKYLVVYKSRPGRNVMPYTLTVCSIIQYSAIPLDVTDKSYKALREVTVKILG